MKKLIDFCNKYGYTLKDKLPDTWNRYGNNKLSITTILSLLEDDGLSYVLKHNKNAVTSSINEGLKTHKEAELFFKPQSGVIKTNPNVIKFHVLYGVKIIGTEVYYEKGDICGTIDLVADIKGNNINVDYKHAKYQSPKYFLQLMGYKYLNGYSGMLVYTKGVLNVIEVDNDYYDIFMELKDYSLNLLNDVKKNGGMVG